MFGFLKTGSTFNLGNVPCPDHPPTDCFHAFKTRPFFQFGDEASMILFTVDPSLFSPQELTEHD